MTRGCRKPRSCPPPGPERDNLTDEEMVPGRQRIDGDLGRVGRGADAREELEGLLEAARDRRRIDPRPIHFDDDEVLFFTPGDAAALAQALLAIARDPAAAQARADAARRRALSYAWDENARRYLLVLDRASARSRP